MTDRRAFLLGTSAVLAAGSRPVWAAETSGELSAVLVALEASLRCRLGVSLLDLETGRRWTHRASERFPLCSTFKLLAAGAVLARVDVGREDLDRRIRFDAADLVPYSPATKERAGTDGMTLAEICAAAITLSDNTAGNLMLDSLGGPGALTAFARSLGDTVTRLDRRETELNEAKPGDSRDTTSPDAMVANLQTLLFESKLLPQSREQLAGWLADSRTGAAKLRAGVPAPWRVGSKTGAGEFGTTNEVGILSPPARRPVLAAIYMTETTASLGERNAAFATIGRTVAAVIEA